MLGTFGRRSAALITAGTLVASTLALLGAATATATAATVPARLDGPRSVTFDTAGTSTWTVPTSVTSITVEAVGGHGGAGPSSAAPNGGRGAVIAATLAVTPGATLQVTVGGDGRDSDTIETDPMPPGGGGRAGLAEDRRRLLAGDGGGASDVRIGGTTLADRMIVAAGGGGGSSFSASGGDAGAAGVSLLCDDVAQASRAAQPGTLAGGGSGGACLGSVTDAGGDGALGHGGGGADYDGIGAGGAGGGGGGGYYGGGGGDYLAGGGGGSSYVVPSATASSIGLTSAAPHVTLSWAPVATPGAMLSLTSATPGPVPADGTSVLPMIVEIRGPDAAPLPGEPLTVTTSGTAAPSVGDVVDLGAGRYSAQIIAPTVAGTGTVTFHDGAAQLVTAPLSFTPLSQRILVSPPAPGDRNVGDVLTFLADADSGLPVTMTAVGAACGNSIVSSGPEQWTATFQGLGICTVTASQPGNGQYAAAADVVVAFTAVPRATQMGLTLDQSAIQTGQAVVATATVDSSSPGQVTFSVDGTPTGEPVGVLGGTATSPPLRVLGVGAHAVGATFTSTTPEYTDAEATPQTVVVSPAATTLTLALTAGAASATVTALAPGSGTPSGDIEFLVDGEAFGTATLVDGVATLAPRLPSGDHTVTATYAGDGSYLASSDSTARTDPQLTTAVSSSSPKSARGWYRSPVIVSFTCTPGSAPLTAACPAPVTFTDGGAQRVSRTVLAADGGVATASVTGINVDTTAPTVSLSALPGKALVLPTAPSCRAKDALSGIASCTVTKATRGSVTTWTAVAIDSAGNRAQTSRSVTVQTTGFVGASTKKGVAIVRAGRSYTLLVTATRRPHYVYAAVAPRRPHRGDVPMRKVGSHRWAITVTFDRAMLRHRHWNVGVRIGTKLKVVRVDVR